MAKILVIDDSEAVLEQLTLLLRAGGFEVMATTRGQDAIATLGSPNIDLILTDIYMPPPDGFEVIQAARMLAPHLPLIVMSTNPIAVDVFRAARALGAVSSLQKPFSAEVLFAEIERVLGNRGRRRGVHLDLQPNHRLTS